MKVVFLIFLGLLSVSCTMNNQDNKQIKFNKRSVPKMNRTYLEHKNNKQNIYKIDNTSFVSVNNRELEKTAKKIDGKAIITEVRTGVIPIKNTKNSIIDENARRSLAIKNNNQLKEKNIEVIKNKNTRTIEDFESLPEDLFSDTPVLNGYDANKTGKNVLVVKNKDRKINKVDNTTSNEKVKITNKISQKERKEDIELKKNGQEEKNIKKTTLILSSKKIAVENLPTNKNNLSITSKKQNKPTLNNRNNLVKNKFYIQLISSRKKSYSEAVLNKYKQNKGFVYQAYVKNKLYYRAVIGPFNSEKEVENEKDRIINLGHYDLFIFKQK